MIIQKFKDVPDCLHDIHVNCWYNYQKSYKPSDLTIKWDFEDAKGFNNPAEYRGSLTFTVFNSKDTWVRFDIILFNSSLNESNLLSKISSCLLFSLFEEIELVSTIAMSFSIA